MDTRLGLPLFIQIPLVLIASLLVLAVLLFICYFLIIHRANGQLMVGGEKRAYVLYVPKSYNPSQPAPLIITFHGFAEWPMRQKRVSGWNQIADRYGFIVVYPMGTSFPLHWGASSQAASAKEVAFISALIDKLENQYTIDPTRVYANGFSNGGGMAFVLSCTMADRIAAIGGVSGAYLYPWKDCHPSRPVPMIAFHGTADPVVPFQGGSSRSFALPFPFIPDWIKTYAQQNGCSLETTEIPSIGKVSGIHYTGCKQGADVIFYAVTNGGHAWPGSVPLPKWVVGMTNQDVNATELIWQFFEQHPLK